MVLVSGIVCIYYNIIMAWALYYIYSVLRSIGTGRVPWESCDNWWNTEQCMRRSGLNGTLANSTSLFGMANGTKKMTPTEEFWQQVIAPGRHHELLFLLQIQRPSNDIGD
jgi:solute carrier family 6 amino acid transporter-like protein 5/7/9/14